MDHLPPVPRGQWRRVQLGRYLIDYCGHRIERMHFDDDGKVTDFGVPESRLDEIINAGTAFRTSGCPGKEAPDVSACDRPYGDSPPRDIASYPFKLNRNDVRKVRGQLKAGRAGRATPASMTASSSSCGRPKSTSAPPSSKRIRSSRWLR